MPKYRGYRHPKTYQEKRQNVERLYNRPKRNPHNLVCAWDDRAKNYTKNWKKTRKTQYKPVNKYEEPPKKDSTKYGKHASRKQCRCEICGIPMSHKRWQGCRRCREISIAESKKYRQKLAAEQDRKDKEYREKVNKSRLMWSEKYSMMVVGKKTHHRK